MWTDDQVAEIKKHIDTGLSRRQVAAIYGVTRNAMVGLCYRQGITGPNNQMIGAMVANERKRQSNILRTARQHHVPEKTTGERWQRKARPAPMDVRLGALPGEPQPLNLSIVNMMGSQCCWVCDGTDDDCLPLYCGHPIVKGSYCAHHSLRVTR